MFGVLSQARWRFRWFAKAVGAFVLGGASLSFAACPFDVNSNSRVDKEDALLLGRYALQLRGNALVAGTSIADATPIENFINANVARLDLDGNASFDRNDAIAIARYALGFRDDALTAGIALSGARDTWHEVSAFIGNGCASPTLNVSAAATYAQSVGSAGILVMQNGNVVADTFFGFNTKNTVKPIASGTKSFSCAIEAAAEAQSLMSIEDLVSTRVPSWASGGSAPQSALKSQARVKDLLSISAGLAASGSSGGGLDNVDTYAQALSAPSLYAPGVAAIYTPNEFQAFGAYFELATGGSFSGTDIVGGNDPVDFLTQTVFAPIGLTVGAWSRDIKNKPNLAGGASLSAAQWIKFGQLILNDGEWNGTQVLPRGLLKRCSDYATPAFLGYGLSFWLNRDVGTTYQANEDSVNIVRGLGWPTGGRFAPAAPADMFMAAGFGGYRMYVIPSLQIIAVRTGGAESSDPNISVDNEFLGRLLGTLP
jgi:CubicO group peptidase (beta-lactamase class C family)